MNWDLFWVHKDLFGPEASGTGFSLFSAVHFTWLALMIAFIAVYAVRYRRGGEAVRDNMRKRMAVFLIFFELFKQCLMALSWAPAREYLPLEICSFAEYVILVDAMWPKNRVLKQLMVFAFLPAAVMALLVPTVTVYPPISFYTIHQFVLHAGIVAYVVARYAAGEIRPRYMGIWTSVFSIFLLIIPIYLINRTFGTNFMFLMHHTGNPLLALLWNLSGGTGGPSYVLAMVAFSAIVLHIAFVIYSLIGWTAERKTKR